MGVRDYTCFAQRNHSQDLKELELEDEDKSERPSRPEGYDDTDADEFDDDELFDPPSTAGSGEAILVLVPKTNSLAVIGGWSLTKFADFPHVESEYDWDGWEFSAASGFIDAEQNDPEAYEAFDGAVWVSPDHPDTYLVTFEPNCYRVFVTQEVSPWRVPWWFLHHVYSNRGASLPREKDRAVQGIIDFAAAAAAEPKREDAQCVGNDAVKLAETVLITASYRVPSAVGHRLFVVKKRGWDLSFIRGSSAPVPIGAASVLVESAETFSYETRFAVGPRPMRFNVRASCPTLARLEMVLEGTRCLECIAGGRTKPRTVMRGRDVCDDHRDCVQDWSATVRGLAERVAAEFAAARDEVKRLGPPATFEATGALMADSYERITMTLQRLEG